MAPQSESHLAVAVQQPLVGLISEAVELTAGHLTMLGNEVGGDVAAYLSIDRAGRAEVHNSPDSSLAARARKAERLAAG